MNATMLTNRVAHEINKTFGRTVVTTCQVPKDKFDGYFKNGVALYFDSLDDFKLVMNTFGDGDIEIGSVNAWLEPYNTTYVGVWED